MNCGMSMVKYVLFIFNLLCALCGILLMIIGGLIISSVKDINDLKEQVAATTFPIAVIILGGLIFIIAFFGCCGAIKESECMSMTYAGLLFVLLVLDIALVALILTTKDSQRKISNTIIDDLWKQKENPKSVMHYVEKNWQCCGVDGPHDYNIGFTIPSSCCSSDGIVCTLNNAYSVGCKQRFSEWVMAKGDIIAYVVLGIVGVELVGFIFACCLANHIRNHRRRSTY